MRPRLLDEAVFFLSPQISIRSSEVLFAQANARKTDGMAGCNFVQIEDTSKK